MRILSLFHVKESRDELGLGGVRDSFSDQFFPVQQCNADRDWKDWRNCGYAGMDCYDDWEHCGGYGDIACCD